MKVYKIGIIGLGTFAQKYITTIQKYFPNIHLAAACRQTNIRPEFLPPNCSFHTDWRELFTQGLDGVIVVTTPEHNLEVIKYSKIPLMVEKPAVPTVEDVKYIHDKVLVNYSNLFAPAFIKLQKLLKQYKIRTITTKTHGKGPIRSFSSLFDYGCHDVSMILSLTKSYPTHIKCMKQTTSNGELFEIILLFNDYIGSYSLVGNGAEEKLKKVQVSTGLGQELFVYSSLEPNKKLVHKKRYERKRAISITYPEYDNDTQPLTAAIGSFLDLIDGKYVGPTFPIHEWVTSILEECHRQAQNQ